MFTSFFVDLTKVFSLHQGNIHSDVGAFVSDVLRLYTNFWSDATSMFSSRLLDLKEMWSGALSDIDSTTRSALNKIRSWISGTAVPQITNAFQRMWDISLSHLVSFLSSFSSELQSSIQSVASWVSSSGTSAFRSAFSSVASAMESEISSAVSSISSSVSSLASTIRSDISSATSSAISDFNSRIPSSLSVPSVRIGGQSLNIPSVNVPNPLGSDWRVGGGSLRVPSTRVGGQSINLPQLADGGIIMNDTLARIGEAGDSEAVVPLDKLAQYLDTAYEVGAETASTGGSAQSSGSSSALTATLRVEGDGALAELIRENAEIVVNKNDTHKANRISRM